MSLERTSTPHGITRLTFGMVPSADSDSARVILGDFCSLLSQKLSLTVLPHRAPSPEALASAIHAGRVHIAWLSPVLLVTSRYTAEVTPLVSSVREGITAYHSVLFSPAESSIRTVHQLAGTRVAWVAPSSAGGYLFPRVSLAHQGLDPRGLFASEAFCNSHGGVAKAVFDGEADVGATFAVFENGDPSKPLVRAGFREVAPGRDANIIDVAGPIPSDVIVAAPNVPPRLRANVAICLQHIDADLAARQPLKVLFGVEGFRTFSPGSMQALRTLVAAGRDLGLVGGAE